MEKMEPPQERTASTQTWRPKLKELFKSCSPNGKIALVGVGNPLRGDDYVGSYIIKSIMNKTGGRLPDGICLLDAEDDVETAIMKLASRGLEHVIFIDACEMGQKPGTASLLAVADTSYPFFTTHGIPLKVLAERFLSESTVWILAIQPKRTEFAEGLAAEIRNAAISISQFIMVSLTDGGRSIAGHD